MTLRVPPLLIAGLLAATAAVLAGGAALAFPDAGSEAKVDAELTPHFGDLLFPPLRRADRFRPTRRHGYRPLRPELYARDARLGPPTDITVDCADPRGGPQPLSDALYYLAPGGTLHVRPGAVCHDSLFVEKPVIIVGEAGSAFAPDDGRRPILEAPPGAPCIAAAPGVAVEVRDMALVDERAGRGGCVQGQDADVALTRTTIRYAGGGSAIDMSGGRLIVRGSLIEARQADSAVLADDTVVQIEGSEIRSQLVGLDLTPGLTAPSSIVDARLIGPSQGDPIEPRTVGVMVRGGQRASGQLTIQQSFIGHWRTGLWLDAGSRADLVSSRIYRTALGVLVDEAEAVVRDSAIGASQVGIYAGSGRLVVDHNRIHGFRQSPIAMDRATIASEREDLVYPDGGGCRPFAGWAPRCLPLDELPYELTVEDAAPDWGVHGPIPIAVMAPGPGIGPGFAPAVSVDQTRTKGISLGVNAGVTFGVTTQRDGRPPVEDTKRVGAGVDVGADVARKDRFTTSGPAAIGPREGDGARRDDDSRFGRGADVGVNVGEPGALARGPAFAEDPRAAAAASGATTRANGGAGRRPDGQAAPALKGAPPKGPPGPNAAPPSAGAPAPPTP